MSGSVPAIRAAKDSPHTQGAISSWPSSYPHSKHGNQPRNLPVKRFDGDPLARADVQHNILCHLFSDTRRVFTNPRPGPNGGPASSGVTLSNGAAVPTPVWPYGASAGCLRRSDETPDEFAQWKSNKARYEKWKRRIAKKHNAARAQEARDAKAARDADAANKAAAATPADDADSDDALNEEEDELDGGASDDGAAQTPDAAAETKADGLGGGDDVDDDDDDENDPLDENEFPQPGCDKLTFKELYIEALLNSGKCTKSMRDKIVFDEEYAEDFAKVCLLVNVGRINTTLAFYPEMKTVLRSYHPIPSMQNNENTRRNMQDAPRMKSLLKAVLLDNERPAAPAGGPGSAAQPSKGTKVNLLNEEAPGDLKEVIRRFRDGTCPPTSVVTLIFLFSLHANDVTALHFPQPHDSHALFYPHAEFPVSSKQRAEAFLWLIYQYLEGPAAGIPGEHANPFDDETSTEAKKVAREAWDAMSEAEQKKLAGAPWKGLVNPDWLTWRKHEDKRRAAAEAIEAANSGRWPASRKEDPEAKAKQAAAAAAAAAAGAGVDADGDVSMKSADGEGGGTTSEAAALVEPETHTHRLLVPTLTIITPEQSKAENRDSDEEIRWGKQMQTERAAFLAKIQEEDGVGMGGAKGSPAGAGSPAPSAGAGVGRGRGRGSALKREGEERGTPSEAADGSFARGRKRHPLANASSGEPKRSRIAHGYDDSPDASPFLSGMDDGQFSDAEPSQTRQRPSLLELDLSLPRQLAHESLPQLAWSRILDRAQRGVGDACYESDEDEFADQDAQTGGERSRGEVWRILRGLCACVPQDVFREDNEAAAEVAAAANSAGGGAGEGVPA